MQAAFALPPGSQPTITNAGRQSADTTLLNLIAAGDEGALKVLFLRHNVLVYRFVLRLADNATLAEDVVSEVFLEVWRRSGSFRSESRVSTWLLAIARHKAKAEQRRRSALPWNEGAALSMEDPADNPEQSLDKRDRSAMLQNCLRRLAPIHREVIDLVHYQEKSVEEVAEIIGIPASTVKTRMFYARCRMGDFLRRAGVHSATI
jgi:RNA polymerase sigma-70 factor (ECF subfamily)